MPDLENPSLTPLTPVDPETLNEFGRLLETRQHFAESLLTLEQDKIQLLAAVRKVDDQRSRLFQKCLVDRGLPPDTTAEIDAKTGVVKIVVSNGPHSVPDTVVG